MQNHIYFFFNRSNCIPISLELKNQRPKTTKPNHTFYVFVRNQAKPNQAIKETETRTYDYDIKKKRKKKKSHDDGVGPI